MPSACPNRYRTKQLEREWGIEREGETNRKTDRGREGGGGERKGHTHTHTYTFTHTYTHTAREKAREREGEREKRKRDRETVNERDERVKEVAVSACYAASGFRILCCCSLVLVHGDFWRMRLCMYFLFCICTHTDR